MSEVFKEGDVVEGKITGIQPYGIFLRLSDVCSGLIHITELEKLEHDNPNRFFKIGQPLKVKILRIKPGGQQAVLRIHRGNSRKRMGASNFETPKGFEGLANEIPDWILEAKKKRYI